MKALVFHKPKDVSVDNVDDPVIQAPTDAIIRVTSTAICGSDLHIYNGMIPQPHDLVLGHEFMGIVEEVGSAVVKIKPGDRVIVPFPIACGHCHFCNMELPTHCENSNPEMYGPSGEIIKMKGAGAALYGYTDLYGAVSGGQAEYARVLYADHNLRVVPGDLPDEQMLFLTDIFPTGWAACEWAQVAPGDTVVVFGCGPVGIMAQKAAWLHGAKRVIGVDRLPYRLEKAQLTAKSEVINYEEVDVAEAVRAMTGGYGADVCIDAVGMEAHRTVLQKAANVLQAEKGSMSALKSCFDTVRRGGRVSVVGVYGSPYDNYPLYQWFEKSIQLMGGQAWVQRWLDNLIRLVADGKVVLDDIITHTVPLTDAAQMYDIFNKKEDNCVKVVLKP
ncbi:zinc-dependent alcohol dehydrogenase [uncultured Chitinophaga sp.]|jgi:Threonine dehydrogenase and related Zn-dependent dehydrogenases|uniref:zinc-dependent alcohol dehydrogenase n=1 Tax=uncultured Chitinophaga sp. TaxID=339340 RepID=UPI00261868F2|nr:zinc-dependent alcohol dehydrogenase [uncultured Chitinophaga sp.]